MKNKKAKLILTAMICITILETIALLKGLNGVLLTSVIGLICAMAGWVAKPPK